MQAQLRGGNNWHEPTDVDLFVNYGFRTEADDPPGTLTITVNQSRYDTPTHGSLLLNMSFVEARLAAHRLLHAIGDQAPTKL